MKKERPQAMFCRNGGVRLSLGLLFLIGVFECLPRAADAHEEFHTHASLTGASFQILNSAFYPAAGTGERVDVRQGSIDEDQCPRFFNHFYNPVTGRENIPNASGLIPGCPILESQTTARDNTVNLWNQAVEQYRRNRDRRGVDSAFHLLGRALHNLQDMTSPAHVHDDPHGGLFEGCGVGPFLDIDDFENWGWCANNPESRHITEYIEDNSLTGRLTPRLAGVQPGFPLHDRSVGGFIHEIAQQVYDFTTFRGELVTRTVLEDSHQPSSELQRMFPSLTFDPFSLQWMIDDIGNSDGTTCGGGEEDDWWPMENPPGSHSECDPFRDANGTRGIRGNFYIENSGGDSGNLTPRVYEKALYANAENTISLLQIYGDTLYPLAVAYGAGLLQVFQEAVSTFPPPPDPIDLASAFVTRLHQQVLGLDPEPGQVAASVETIQQDSSVVPTILAFFHSAEFLGRNTSNEEFLTILYRTFLDRDPDPAGFNAFLTGLQTGQLSRDNLLDIFIDSAEFVSQASFLPPLDSKTAFVTDLYVRILGRGPDLGGLQGFVTQLQQSCITPTVLSMIRSFLASPEFLSRNTSNTEFVTLLYRVFLGRVPDAGGLTSFAALLNQGTVTRDQLLTQFAASSEFQTILQQLCS